MISHVDKDAIFLNSKLCMVINFISVVGIKKKLILVVRSFSCFDSYLSHNALVLVFFS